MIRFRFYFLFLLCFTASCSWFKKDVPRDSENKLSKNEALLRSSAITDLSYFFEVDLSTAVHSEYYTGRAQIFFNFNKENYSKKNLTLDFHNGTVVSFIVNSTASEFEYNKNFITFPIKNLKPTSNTLTVEFKHNFSKTGNGLYKFTDPIDKKVYVYTDFEPYDANQFVPLFDQPDLKARYSLNVKAPKNWQVISTLKEQQVEDKGNYNLWSFPKSQKFSTYIFSLHAGPYYVWTDEAQLLTKKIPLRLFARQTLAKYVKPDFWFKITKQGFSFFENYFETEFPYTKYDQVIVPDFNSGAMENVASVTFNEFFVSRDQNPLRSQRRTLANVIFHEMAHMWFGNLVTMKWWNDLWLNESFATFMAYTGLYYNTEYSECWLNFFNRTKRWAYTSDQWRTTHPIESKIPSTEEALSNFDGITYGKGASSLKQLVFLIGENNFKKGLKDYFSKYAETNTKRSDFLNSLQKHTQEDLTRWASEWIESKGLNGLEVKFQCADGALKELTLKQTVVSGDPVFRMHKTQMALWTKDQIETPSKVFSIRYSGQETKWTPTESLECPVAVFANWDDYDFIIPKIDQNSLEFFSKNITHIKSSLFRAQYWSLMGQSLMLGELRPDVAYSSIFKNLDLEKNTDVLSKMLNVLTSNNQPIFYYYQDQNVAKTHRKKLVTKLKNIIVDTKDTEIKKILFSSWTNFAALVEPDSLFSCIKKCDFNNGFEIDIDTKWGIALELASIKYNKIDEIKNTLSKLDSSQRAKLNLLAINTRLEQNKTASLKKALDKESDLSLKERNVILYNLVPYAQLDSHRDFIEESFYKNINNISALPERVKKIFARQFAPLFCNKHTTKKPFTQKVIENSNWSFGVKKILLESLDIEERCLKTFSLYAKEETK